MTPEIAANLLLKEPDIDGITISGGEPMAQAFGLAKMVQLLRERKELHILCFSGYRYEQLLKQPEETGIPALLTLIDVLVDGPFIQNLNNGTTFAGSSNQRILSLSQRPIPGDQVWPIRKMELHIRNGMILTVGVPPTGWDRNITKDVTRLD
jgi:anaerobic ribonucleoside-triphosphate reductase activating protein